LLTEAAVAAAVVFVPVPFLFGVVEPPPSVSEIERFNSSYKKMQISFFV
jgi:hypothetical protein